MLRSEREPEPGVDERPVDSRHERVVPGPTLLDPGPGSHRVEVADELGLLHGMPGELDPDVCAPDRVVASDTQEIAYDLSAAVRDHA